jgi:colanic acid/amylovoran biosynthesis glycosyltransferase
LHQLTIRNHLAQRNQATIFTDKLLPLSQTFVLEQTRHVKNWEARLVGLESISNGIDLSGIDARVMYRETSKNLQRFNAALYKLTRKDFFAEDVFRETDIIHAHFAPNGSLMVPVAEKLNVPLITTFHGYDILTNKSAISLRKDLNHAMFARRDDELKEKGNLFIVVSDFLKQRALELGYPESRIKQHYIGVDVDSYAAHCEPEFREPNTVIFVGRLVEKKGVKYLLEAFKTVSEKNPLAKLKIIGNGPMIQLVEAAVNANAGRIEYLGSKNHEQVLRAVNRSAILCVPSCTAADGNSETFGMVFAEAMALGIPVVSSWHGGIPEVVKNDVTGLLAKERDSAELAECLLGLLSDSNAREKMGIAGKERVSNLFDIRKQSKSLESIYASFT